MNLVYFCILTPRMCIRCMLFGLFFVYASKLQSIKGLVVLVEILSKFALKFVSSEMLQIKNKFLWKSSNNKTTNEIRDPKFATF